MQKSNSFSEVLSKTLVPTFAMPGSTDGDSTDQEKNLSLPSARKKTSKTTKTGQPSESKGVGGVESRNLLNRLSLNLIFSKKSRDIRAAVREDIVSNIIAPLIQKFHCRETLHLAAIYDLQARPVSIEERTYQTKIRSCEETIENLKTELQLANTDLTEMNKELSKTAKSLMESSKEVKCFIKKSQPSFSNVLQSRPTTTTRVPFTNQRSDHAVLLRPKGKGTTSDDNRKIVENALVCRNSAARVNRISKVSNGGLIIEAPSSADLQVLRAEIECIPALENHFDISKPKRRRPQVILSGLDNEIDKDRFLKGLSAKNHLLCDTKNNPLFEINFPIKARRNTNWVISVDPSCYKRLFHEQGLYFEFSRCRFDNFFSVKYSMHSGRSVCPG
ncbi:hypothetical protein AVEN_153249-1 [Araneus ventricosus]|uniref:Uncharacterized protein n=1 Tax=Araneus ventricosus TaxID=182803 RepID=A0A4Y2K100_ARAVE|nr:hypothetical protein AVEN_153249-1 [Araneus ventricosus]